MELPEPSLLKTKTKWRDWSEEGKAREDAKTNSLSSMTEGITSTLFLKANTNGK